MLRPGEWKTLAGFGFNENLDFREGTRQLLLFTRPCDGSVPKLAEPVVGNLNFHHLVTFQAMKTVSIRAEDVKPGAIYAPEWLLIDATGKPLGRIASQVSKILRGKHKPIFTPHLDTGDFVIVINAEKVKLTGAKMKDKYYYHHTGYPGGLKAVQAAKLREKKPAELMRPAGQGRPPGDAA